MIESVRLQNYQSWEDQLFVFLDGVNALMGVSDSGKSAVIRAMAWCLFNDKAGKSNSFIRNGAKEAIVTIVINGYTIVRKTGKENLYILDGQEFRAFGTNVPEPIQAAVGMNSINFQGQFEPHFLLSDTPSEVARKLNQIVDLMDIDAAQSGIHLMAVRNNSQITANADLTLELEEKLKGFGWIVDADAELSRVEKMEAKVLSKRATRTHLTGLLESIGEVEMDLARDGQLCGAECLWAATAAWENLKGEAVKSRTRIRSVLDQLEALDEELAEEPEFGAIYMAIGRLGNLNRMLDSKLKLLAGIKSCTVDINRLDESLRISSESIIEMQAEFDELMPETCPLCGVTSGKEGIE